MFEAEASEFPFVTGLPRREKSKLGILWDQFTAARALVNQHGMLFPQHYAATLLGISRQRVHVLVNEGRLQSVELAGLRYVTEASMMEYAKAERKSGRHVEAPSVRETFKSAMDSARTRK